MIMRYVFNTTVASVTEEFKDVLRAGTTEYDKVSLGWFVLLTGSWEKLYVGQEEPGLKRGDLIKVTIEKVT